MYVSPSKLYYGTVRGVKQDLKRHDEDIRKIKAKIAELEVSEEGIDKRMVHAYRSFLSKVEQSKALVASQIGKQDTKDHN